MSQPARLGYRRWDKNHQEWGYNNDIMKKKIEIGHSVTAHKNADTWLCPK
jgi:hypothetical protein